MYRLKKKNNNYVAYNEVIKQEFNNLDELIDCCYKYKLFNQDIQKEKLKTELDVDWYLTDLVTEKFEK